MDFPAKKEELMTKGQEVAKKINELNIELLKINAQIDLCNEELGISNN